MTFTTYIYRRADQQNWPITALCLRVYAGFQRRIEHCVISR